MESATVNVEIDLWTSWVIRARLLLKHTGEPLIAEIRTRDGVYVSGRDGRFMIQVPPLQDYWEYSVWVPLRGTDLKPWYTTLDYDPRVRDVDLGDILIERRGEE